MARGSITPRPSQDGKRISYRIKWESRGPDGKRRHHSATRATKKEAERFLAEKLAEVNEGTFITPAKETVGAYLDRWLQAVAPGWSESTLYQNRTVVRRRIVPFLGSVPLSRLDILTIQGWTAELLEEGYAPSTVNATLQVLQAALSRAVRWGLLAHNPATGVAGPAVPRPAPKAWTAAEAATFLAANEAESLAALWRLGLDSGMRLGEMLALPWSDFDPEGRVVVVRRTLTRHRGGGWRIGDLTKTTSSRRSILLGEATVAALRVHRVRQAERRLAHGGAWHDGGLIFDRGDGKALNPQVAREAFDRAVVAAGVPTLTPHGMRHTMATLLLSAGVHPKIVQERLGHASIKMTLDIYSHVTVTMQASAAELLDGLLSARARPKRGHEAG